MMLCQLYVMMHRGIHIIGPGTERDFSPANPVLVRVIIKFSVRVTLKTKRELKRVNSNIARKSKIIFQITFQNHQMFVCMLI